MITFGLPAVDYVVIGVYLVFMLGIGFYFTRFMKGEKTSSSEATSSHGGFRASRST